MNTCIYCQKEFAKRNGITLHQRSCKFNPNRVAHPNQWTNGYTWKPETLEKISQASKKQIWCEEKRARQSIIMKRAVENNPESYTSSNRGRTKQIEYKEIKFQGQWELDFYMWCEEQGIAVERSKVWFDYNWNGARKYNPDFYLPELNTYVEVKGYETDRDRNKWLQFPKNLVIIKAKQIFEIRKGIFNLRLDS
jgi:hypothetical protein